MERHPNLAIGFVDKVFISENLIRRYQLKPKMNIKGLAVRAFDKKKKSWGWAAFKIEPL
ncbi:hypothetical protein [Thermophagus xiamenensis]|uniref:hypothetical protein n=1 Tax=Thermophagus xiamenensis TaxID=385682 RepID=UPI00358EC9B0